VFVTKEQNKNKTSFCRYISTFSEQATNEMYGNPEGEYKL